MSESEINPIKLQFLLLGGLTLLLNAADPIYVAYHDEEWGVPVHDDECVTPV